MFPRIATILIVLLTCAGGLLHQVHCRESEGREATDSKKYTFLYYVSTAGNSHFSSLSVSGIELVRQGHKVVSLLSSSNSDQMKAEYGDVFSYFVFNSSYTQQQRSDVTANLGKAMVRGTMKSIWGMLVEGIMGNVTDFNVMLLRECDDLLGDSTTMKRLREERFDTLVADDASDCTPLLAQALDVPFVYSAPFYANPSKNGFLAGLTVDPSYIPERLLDLTDRMDFFQRVKNVLAHAFYVFLWHMTCNYCGYDKLKIKYNIKPEIGTFESNRQVALHIFHGSFALEFPRPMQPNTVYSLFTAGRDSNQTLQDDVKKFLETAPNGVVLFSLGTFIHSLTPEKARVLADGFAMLPYRVLWQTKYDLPDGIKVAENIKVVRWVPLAQIMEHDNVKVYVFQGGTFGMYEALWAGLPLVGLPMFEDQPDNLVRIEDRGVGLALDFNSLTPDILNQTIQKVTSEPSFEKNALRIAMILRDLQTSSPPVKTAAHWILHVAKFGGDHLRPAVQDLTFLQRNLTDVYLFLLACIVFVAGVCVTLCNCCCKCICKKRGYGHAKSE